MAEDRKQLRINGGCLRPMLFVPRLELGDFWALKAHIEFHVLSETWPCEIRRSDEGGRTHDSMAAMSDVRLGVELPRLVDADFDFSVADPVDNRLDTGEVRVTLLTLDLD